MTAQNRENTALWFRSFADACRDRSRLYSHLATSIAADGELLDLAVSPRSQPPHILLAAVHFLLLKGADHPLAEFYASVQPRTASPENAPPVFRDFCKRYKDAITQLVSTRLVQTNEVGRCSYLYPAFSLAAESNEGRPLALVELGTSAGLNLLFDKYENRYANEKACGAVGSTVQIPCELRGLIKPRIPPLPPSVAFRCGIDLNIIDVDSDDQSLWLRSMIWPEQHERAALLKSAIEIARRERPRLIESDALAGLNEVIDEIPNDCMLCVFHTHTIHTWPPDLRDTLQMNVADIASRRPLVRISAEQMQTPTPVLRLSTFQTDIEVDRLLARCDEHGRWLEWLDETTFANSPDRRRT